MTSALPDPRDGLRADCSRCAALCCVAPAFAASADFAIDKPAGTPCPKLASDFRCGIHADLRGQGFPGCAVFDCFGAGQHLVQGTFDGRTWRESPQTAREVFAAFPAMRQLHESRWYLAEALERLPDGPLRDEAAAADAHAATLADGAADALAGFDAAAHRREVGDLLGRVSAALRKASGHRGRDRSGTDLIGARLRGADLRGASLRGAYLLGADLRNADLRFADLLGADLRAADVRGARLDQSLFLTQPQVDAARGDAATILPAVLRRPAHWPAR
ncbi:pentapeptide repeat-containing protein [Motilibacter deserti]|uniref:Pentapeptide repeat-containing protein n=1 Tax=Motilibacter deserti TaxID=2714956 RepID=A0ABX0H3A6_9ACTN|nr:pentapeptide repeat-containing protein [Motilibacter deserti]NHC16440.1 pentapeptide repeat-containing protein [Motilibacter deserti]